MQLKRLAIAALCSITLSMSLSGCAALAVASAANEAFFYAQKGVESAFATPPATQIVVDEMAETKEENIP